MEETKRKSDSEPDLASMPIPKLQCKRAALMAKSATILRDTISDDSDNEDDTKQQIIYGNACQATWALLLEYCDYSNIHGIRYLGEKKRQFLERLFWITSFILSIYICTILIMNIWDKWNSNPVIVSFAEKPTPVWQIPFPAVTICPDIKARRNVFNFTNIVFKVIDKLMNTSHEELTELEYVETKFLVEEFKTIFNVSFKIFTSSDFYMNAQSQVCLPHVMKYLGYGKKTAVGQKLVQALTNTMSQFEDTFVECKFRNIETGCHSLFSEIISEEGMCYSFNSLSPSEVFRTEGLISDFTFKSENRSATDWNIEDWYRAGVPPITYPNRVMAPGARSGLYLVLKGVENDFDLMCRGPNQGFKILLTTPGEIAQVSEESFHILFGQEKVISIQPKIMTTSEALKRYEPHRRQCYYQKERYLRYFLLYTQSNCKLECLANYTLAKCHCVKFSMPRGDNVPVCGAASINCIKEAKEELFLKNIIAGMDKAENELFIKSLYQRMKISKEYYHGATECNCLPSCSSIVYEADFHYKTTWSIGEKTEYIPGAQVSRVSIFFTEVQFQASKRSELFGTIDIIANWGGLLGLFMGASFFSLVEIFYFCTLRLMSNLKMRNKKRKKIENSFEASKEA